MFSVAYPMVKNTTQWLQQQYDIELQEMPISFPIASETVFLQAVQNLLDTLQWQDELSQLKMVILDHIVLTPAVKKPIDQLAALIKTYAPHAFVLVDGAYVMGQIPNLSFTNIDAYLSNGHKW